MTKQLKFVPVDQQYKNWLRTNPIKNYSDDEIKSLDDGIRQKITEELNITGEMDIKEFMLLHKYNEVKDFVSTQDPNEIEEVRNLIWKPVGRSDFRRIQPELILTSDSVDIKKVNFWGDVTHEFCPRDEKLTRHWKILRVLLSSARHDGVMGRQLRYIVRDKVTKSYLGIICMGSSMMNLSDRNKDVFGGSITENKESKEHFKKAFGKGGRSVNMTNGQTIVSTQPFGSNFNGGKLLSLLCISKQIQDDWKDRYGDVLVTVETTSLYGGKDSTQYDGMKPYWRNLGKTSGDTPIKPSDELWESIQQWVKKRHPTTFFHYKVETNEKFQPKVRDKKNGLISRTYGLLGIKKNLNTSSGHERGVFLSKLYVNSDEFLQCKINEDDLIPSFDNSIERLTEFWRFGFSGDTQDSPVHTEIIKHAINSKVKHSNKNSPAKKRLNDLVERGSTHIDLDSGWYEPMSRMTWFEVKEKFLDQISR